MLHDTKMHLLALGLVALVALIGCSEKPPVRATYTPADCPTVPEQEPEEEAVAEVEADPVLEPVEEVDDPLVVELNPVPTEEKPVEEVTIEEAEQIVAAEAVDLNTASLTDLMRLPGVGPALARRIVEYREKRRFERASDIRRVKGIGPAKYAKIEPMLRVE